MKGAAYLGEGLADGPEDLVQEALLRAMSGVRRCPAGTDIVVFLQGVIRSLASAARKRGGLLGPLPLDEESVSWVPEPSGRRAATENLRQRLLNVFAESTRERLIVTLMLRGYRGAQIRDRTGLSMTELATARRRIRRWIERAKREGKL